MILGIFKADFSDTVLNNIIYYTQTYLFHMYKCIQVFYMFLLHVLYINSITKQFIS